MELVFPPLCGGVSSGLNDAGIETFEGNFAKNVIRECAQNSLDAAISTDQIIEIKVERFSLKKSDLPFLPKLKIILEACRDHWRSNTKALNFFERALKSISNEYIDSLKISDLGTTGLDGKDDEITGRWFGLVKSRGVSNQKTEGSGGAFGIGKDAPLAGSSVRTVLYSTCTLKGEVAFQGVCRLVTHPDENGILTQGTGFIGKHKSSKHEFLALRNKSDIPQKFLRDKPGLDLWVIGSKHLEEEWAQPFIRSALSNFWPAISDGKIRFVIGSDTIDQNSLGVWMQKERYDKDVSKAWPYYCSLVDRSAKKIESVLANAGKCRLHLLLAKKDLPKKICLVRQTGMVIDYYSPKVTFLPFSGLFVCEDKKGNSLLKTLEPPRHDKWDTTRAEDSRAAKALTELKEWIKEEVKKQIPFAGENEFNETEVPPDLLEHDPLSDDFNPEAETDLGGQPKNSTRPENVPLHIKVMKREDKPGRTESQQGKGDHEGGKTGDGKRTGGKVGRGDSREGGRSLIQKVPQLTTRAYSVDSDYNSYELILRSDDDYSGAVWLEAVGEDGFSEGISLESAEIEGQGLRDVEYNKISEIPFRAGETVRIRVLLKRGGKYSLKAYF